MARLYRLEHRTQKSLCYKNSITFSSPYEISSMIYDMEEISQSNQKVLLAAYRLLSSKHNHGDYRPAPFQDGIDMDLGNEFCGSPCINTLDEWFDGFLDLFIGLGFVVREYIVDDIKIGDSGLQCSARYIAVHKSKIIDLKLA